MKKFMDSPLLRRARAIRAVWTTTAPKSRRDPNCFVSTERCGSRRTVGIDGVRVNLAIPTTPGSLPRGRNACCSVFKDHARPPPWPAIQPDLSTFAASAEAKALTRAHRAPRYVSVSVCGRSRRCVKRSGTARRGFPPERSWENTTRRPAVKALRIG
jgi:hypothetical protein